VIEWVASELKGFTSEQPKKVIYEQEKHRVRINKREEYEAKGRMERRCCYFV